MKRLALIILFAIGHQVMASSEGESIYMTGLDSQGLPIPSRLNDLRSESPLACVTCHRESGFGSSESGQTIPPVSWRFLGRNQPETNSSRFYRLQNKRQAYDAASLHRLLTQGIDSNGDVIDRLMPRYAMSREQSDHVLDHLKTLYSGADPGVDTDILRIATIVDSRLPQAQTDQHIEFLHDLFAMKNGLTRGELKRKKFSPIQKIPQYESYRSWKLVIWKLPQNPDQWVDFLRREYAKEPVFMVIRPLVKNDYAEVARFCSDSRLPCLFPSGNKLPSGDYYNFVFRDRAKQQRDYLADQKRTFGERLLYINKTGRIVPVDTGLKKLPSTVIFSPENLQKDFNRYCNGDYVVLSRAGLEQAKVLDELSCSLPSVTRIKVIVDDDIDYQRLKGFISQHQDSRLCWVSDYHRVIDRNPSNIRVNAMVRRFDIKQPQYESLALSLFSYSLIGDALHQLAGNFSRLYLIEVIEHMLNSVINYTFFSSISGAPYQRYIVGPIRDHCKPGPRA
jgi:hypothetical protein